MNYTSSAPTRPLVPEQLEHDLTLEPGPEEMWQASENSVAYPRHFWEHRRMRSRVGLGRREK